MPADLIRMFNRALIHVLDGVEIEMLRYLAGAGGVALLLAALAGPIAHRRIQKRRAARADVAREVRQSVRTIVVFAFVDFLTVALMLAGVITLNEGPAAGWRVACQIVLLIVLHDAWFYWMHRLLHRPGLFRWTHMAHHLSRTPTPWAAYSFAGAEAVTEALVIPAMFLIVSRVAPVEPWAVFIFLGHQIARNAIGHAGHELAWSGFTRSRWTGWLTTTTHHDLHHSEGRHNSGLYFTWWDRWMGTEHPRYHDRFEAVVTRPAQTAAPARAAAFSPSSE